MPPPDWNNDQEIKTENPPTPKKTADNGKVAPTIKGETKQKKPFKKTRAGEVLTKEQIKEIKIGRKKLRKQLRDAGIKNRKEFELTASSLGLYFDKHKWFPMLLWFLHGRGLWALLGALLTLLTVLFATSLVSQMQGHFTINLTDGLFQEGFTLSETRGFENPTMRLFAQPSENVPGVSIVDIKTDVNEKDGEHNEPTYFAYTFYIRNEGENTVSYRWNCSLNSESRNLSDAAWVMIFEDDLMRFYAKEREDGTAEALPPFGDNTRGYLHMPIERFAKNPEEQFQVITSVNGVEYLRMVPYTFESEDLIAEGTVFDVEPMETHKYTVVIWLEGDDPDCTDELIGGHAGLQMGFELVEELDEEDDVNVGDDWKKFWENTWKKFLDSLKFWE